MLESFLLNTTYICKKIQGGFVMDSLTLIFALSAVLWYCVDRFKPLWENVSWGKYITMLIAAAGSFALVFSFNLDLIAAVQLVPEMTIAG